MGLELPFLDSFDTCALLHYSHHGNRNAINASPLLLKLARGCLNLSLLSFTLTRGSGAFVDFDTIASPHDAAFSVLQTAIGLTISLIEWFCNRRVLSHQYFDFYGLIV